MQRLPTSISSLKGDNNQEKDKLSSMQWSDLGLLLVWVMVDQIDKIDLEL